MVMDLRADTTFLPGNNSDGTIPRLALTDLSYSEIRLPKPE